MANVSALTSQSPVAVAHAPRVTGEGPSADRLDGYGEQSFSFGDFLSILNPLQHIPIVGSIYRAVTGDTLAPAAKVIGGALFGGPVGLVASAFNAIIEQTTGADLTEQALALVLPSGDNPAPAGPQYATAPPPAGASDADAESPASVAGDASNVTPPLAMPADELSAALPAVAPSHAARAPGRPGAPNGKGLTLADYRASMGQPLPVFDTTRTASSTTAPVRFQTTSPLAERARASIQPAPRDASDSPAAPGDESRAERKADEAPMDPFVAAMMRGLDRYREMKQARPAPGVIDASL